MSLSPTHFTTVAASNIRWLQLQLNWFNFVHAMMTDICFGDQLARWLALFVVCLVANRAIQLSIWLFSSWRDRQVLTSHKTDWMWTDPKIDLELHLHIDSRMSHMFEDCMPQKHFRWMIPLCTSMTGLTWQAKCRGQVFTNIQHLNSCQKANNTIAKCATCVATHRTHEMLNLGALRPHCQSPGCCRQWKKWQIGIRGLAVCFWTLITVCLGTNGSLKASVAFWLMSWQILHQWRCSKCKF